MAVTPLLDLAGFKARTVMPSAAVDELESIEPGWTLQQLTSNTAWMYSLLRKRYVVPFAAPPYPEAAVIWLARLSTPDVYRKRGVNPHDPQLELIEKDRDRAITEIREAADAEKGLYDLPLLDTAVATAATRGGPFVHAEASPYAWTHRQREAARGR